MFLGMDMETLNQFELFGMAGGIMYLWFYEWKEIEALETENRRINACRPRNARFVMKYKNAKGTQEAQDANEDYFALVNERPYLKLTEWSVNDIQSNPEDLGLSGSPTKVKNIESVVFQAKEAKVLTGTDAELDAMMKELITNHTIG